MELVLPDGASASPDLARLHDAYAGRLFRSLAARTSGSAIVHKLAELARTEPAVAREIVRDPTISVLVECDRMKPAVAAIGVALARHGRLGPTPRPLDALGTTWSVAANVRVEGAVRLALSDGTLWVDGLPLALDDPDSFTSPAGVTVERPFPEITPGVRLARFDPNPLALDETHPEKSGNALSLGDVPVERWLESLREAFALVEHGLPSVAAEMRQLLRLVIPVGASDERHLSASYREYVGAVYLTLHRDPSTMAEALVHEFQHNKLNLLSFHYPILENGYDFLYRSPVRPDPRPLMGILLAAHAFVPVAELHRRLLDEPDALLDEPGLRRRLVDVVARNDEALRVLSEHGRPAPAGERVLARLVALHQKHLALVGELPQHASHVA